MAALPSSPWLPAAFRAFGSRRCPKGRAGCGPSTRGSPNGATQIRAHTPKRAAPCRNVQLPVTPHAARKWSLLAAFWIAQAAAAYAALIVWSLLADGVNGPAGILWGTVSWPRFAAAATDRDALLYGLALIAVVTILQAIFLIPVRRPVRADAPGWPVTVSLAVAGLGAAALAVAAALVALEAIDVLTPLPLGSISERTLFTLLALWALISWAIATPLLIAFCRRGGRGSRGSRERPLSRAASTLFLGTVVETAAIMPIDVMIRRRTDCYCGGAYLGLILCGSVGLLTLGPAILIPILARRRKRSPGGLCDVCGYDMRGCPAADRCPECGAGCRPAPGA